MSIVNLALPKEEVLIALINAVNERQLNVDDVAFDDPIALTAIEEEQTERNTRILTYADKLPYTGYRIVYYIRLNINRLFNEQIVGIPEQDVPINMVLSKLTEYYGIDFNESDFSVSVAPTGEDEFHYVVTALNSNFLFIPGTSINVAYNQDSTWFERYVDRVWIFVNYRLPEAFTIGYEVQE